LSPLQQIALGCVVGMIALGVPMACTSSGGLSPVVRCQLDALKVLPEDPLQATVHDAVDVIQRVRACHEQADGGS
jgi:hypothetical protein